MLVNIKNRNQFYIDVILFIEVKLKGPAFDSTLSYFFIY